jgi:serine O-acetyltransferase
MATFKKIAKRPNSLLGTLVGVQWHVLRLYRLAEHLRAHNHHQVAGFLLAIGRIISGIEIVLGAEIGEGTIFVHGNGIVVGPGARIGKRCVVFHEVTVGSKDGVTYPAIGDDVVLYPGAKILGDLTIGDGAVVGANAVVLEDVAPGAVVAGVPARVISRRNT